MYATKKNMDRLYRDGVLAYSPRTGEEYSANPGDYWYMAPADAVKDSTGHVMVLITKRVVIEPA